MGLTNQSPSPQSKFRGGAPVGGADLAPPDFNKSSKAEADIKARLLMPYLASIWNLQSKFQKKKFGKMAL